MQKGIQCLVSGKVQGVFFRASTQEKAKALGITGWVRNLTDGRVEVQAFGEDSALTQFKGFLEVGPSGAKVDALSWMEIPLASFDDFQIKATGQL